MNIQKRIYKYYEQKNIAQQQISGIADVSNFNSHWIDENNFVLNHKNPLIFFSLEGNIAQIEEKNKLRVFVTTDWTFLMLFILPAGLVFYGLMKLPNDSAKGILYAFIGISISIFIFLIVSIVVHNLKKGFKEALKII